MKTLLSVYGINALAFLSNLGAVFVFLSVAGSAGYGSYGIYIVFLAIYYLWDISLIKATLIVHEDARRQGESNPTVPSAAFLRGSFVPFAIGSVVLIGAGNLIYPIDPATGIGGTFVMLIVALEHLLSYPANRLAYHLTLERRFRSIYALRLAATLLRHAFSWSVLLVTGSVFWALVAILAKGAIVGAVSLIWIGRRYTFPRVSNPRFRLVHVGTLLSFFFAAAVVVVMQELPSFFIDRSYGREALGTYRTLYDIVAAVWFVATIYPTILFSHLLIGKAQRTRGETTALLAGFGDRLALFHLAYFFGVCTLIVVERSFLWGILENAPYAFGVVAGVSILGYSRFLIEVAQAYGLGRHVLAATIAATLGIALVFMIWRGEADLAEIGWAWLIGQTMFFLLLKTILLTVMSRGLRTFRDAALLLLPIALIAGAEHVLLPAALLAMCVAGATLSLSVLLILMRRSLAPPAEAARPEASRIPQNRR